VKFEELPSWTVFVPQDLLLRNGAPRPTPDLLMQPQELAGRHTAQLLIYLDVRKAY